MTDFIAIVVLAVIIIAAALYIRKAKKSGVKCIGCPHGASCGSNRGSCGGSCGSCSCSCGGNK